MLKKNLSLEGGLFLGILALSFTLVLLDFLREPVAGFPGYRWMMGGLGVLLLALGLWTWRGGLKGPVRVFLSVVFTAFCYVALQWNGVASVTVTMQILLIFLALPLAGWGTALAVALAATASLWILAALPIPLAQPSPFIHARNLTLVFLGALLLVWWYNRRLEKTAEALRRANADLEARVVERTGQVLVAEKLAAIGRLSAGLAHELNTPLGAVVSASASAQDLARQGVVSVLGEWEGLEASVKALILGCLARGQAAVPDGSHRRDHRRRLERILRTPGPPVSAATELIDHLCEVPDLTDEEARALAAHPQGLPGARVLSTFCSLGQALDLVQQGSQRMSLVVRSFQALARQEEPQEGAQAVDPAGQISTALLLLKGRIPRGTEVEVQCEPGLRVLCREARLGQVLLNLLLNALQAMPTGGVLRLSARSEGGRGILEVADTGPGVPEELRERIFEPFFTTKSAGEGLGLGLDLSRKICREGGSLELIHQPGLPRFVVSLPRA